MQVKHESCFVASFTFYVSCSERISYFKVHVIHTKRKEKTLLGYFFDTLVYIIYSSYDVHYVLLLFYQYICIILQLGEDPGLYSL